LSQRLGYEKLRELVRDAAALRSVTEYQPVGGAGDKIFPPTYEGGQYAFEKRRLPGEIDLVDCVLLDSVQSQANRMELALLDAWRSGRIPIPVVLVDFGLVNSDLPEDQKLPKVLEVSSLEAPHRIVDALIRDSLLDGTPFRRSELGKQLDHVDLFNATPLFEICPTALVFGMWDSTGPRGGLGAKFARAMVSEMVGYHAVPGKRTSSRIDPAQITLSAGPLYKAKDADKGIGWTLDKDAAEHDVKKGPVKLGKDGKPSEANHGNVTPTIAEGGVTISKAIQTTVISMPALRRLRFPLNGSNDTTADEAARATLAALGVAALSLYWEKGADLRSRCHLQAIASPHLEAIKKPGEAAEEFVVDPDSAVALYREAVEQAKKASLPWRDEVLRLRPSEPLVELVRKSQELAAGIGDTATK